MIKFVRSVGTAPGTTTMQLGASCPPDLVPIHLMPNQNVKPGSPAAGVHQVYLNPETASGTVYADNAALKGGLGVVTYPATINRTLTTNSGFELAKSFDYQYNQNVSDGFYFDTQLGTIPSDDELAKNHCYTPVHSGWVTTLGEGEAMASQQKWALILQAVATTAISIVATVTIYRAVTGK